MKKILLSVSALAAIFLSGSCQREDIGHDAGTDEVTITIQIPHTPQTKAVADGSDVTSVYYEVYDEAGVRVFPAADVQRIFPSDSDENVLAVTDGKASLEFKALKNARYDIVFWAMGDEAPYTWSDLGKIEMNYSIVDAERDAFYGSAEVTAASFNQTVTLKRPFALLNIGAAKDEIVMQPAGQDGVSEPYVKYSVGSAATYVGYNSTTVTVSGIDDAFNALTGVSTGNQGSVSKTMTDLAMNPGTGENEGYLIAAGEEYVYLFYQYVLPSSDEDAVVDINATFTYSDGQNDYARTNVPVKANHRTNIVGRVFTGTGSLEVSLEQWNSTELEYAPVTTAEEIQDIIDGLPAGGTAEINLGGDIIFDNEGSQVQSKASSVSSAIHVPSGKTVTINFGGNTISWSTDHIGTQLFKNEGTLILKGDGLASYAYTGEPDTSYGKGNYTISNSGSLVIDGPVVENVSGPISHASYAVDNNSINSPASFTLESGKVENLGNHAMRQIGGGQPNSVIVNGGEIIGLTRAIWIQLPGSDASEAPIVTLDVNGGRLEGKEVDSSENQLAVYSYSYGNDMKNVTINVTDGTFVGDIALTGGKNKTNIETLNISGGSFMGLWGCAYSYGEDAKAQKAISITGGTFNYDVSFFVPEGWKVVKKYTDVWVVEPAGPAATVGGTEYRTMQEALNAVSEENNLITLVDDVVVRNPAYGENALNFDKAVDCIIDLAGHTLSADTGNSVLRFNITSSDAVSNVTVTLKNGTVVSGENTWCSVMACGKNADAKAILNLENLTVKSSRPGDFAVKSWENAVVNAKDVTLYPTKSSGGFYAVGGEMVLENCNVYQEGLHTSPYLSMAFGVSNGGKLQINSGIYSTTPAAASEGNNQGSSHGSWAGGIMNSGGTLIINGGTFSNGNYGDDALATAARGCILVDTGAVLEIHDGTFNALEGIIDYQNNLGDASKNPIVTIKGGTYSADPFENDYVNAPDGYVSEYNNGTWTVKAE